MKFARMPEEILPPPTKKSTPRMQTGSSDESSSDSGSEEESESSEEASESERADQLSKLQQQVRVYTCSIHYGLYVQSYIYELFS